MGTQTTTKTYVLVKCVKLRTSVRIVLLSVLSCLGDSQYLISCPGVIGVLLGYKARGNLDSYGS